MEVKEQKVVSKPKQTIPYYLYTDPNVLRVEQEKIFAKSWQFVGHISQLANQGDYFTCEVAGEPIIVVRGKDEEIRAFYNVCPHRATKLEKKEEGNRKVLQCGYHGWTFNLDGSLHKAPNFKDVPDFCSGSACLRSVRVETEASLIFVNLDESAKPLAESYGDFFEDLNRFEFIRELKKVRQKTRVIKANWKAFIDNYLECDHCPISHPALVATLDMNNYKIIPCENYSIQGTTVKRNKQVGSVELDKAEMQGGRFYWLWPNLMVTIYPGPGNMSLIQMIPIDHETTLGVYTYFFRDENLTQEELDLIKFMEQVRDEDVELVELEQIGFRSRAFKKGIFSPTENGVVQFHDMIREVIEIEEE
ncbi:MULTISPECIES: aromatic ring-hydroxylating oxygenase subunit alpha [Aneurinibacillus]|uniref:Aromatic ring-hydroxylating dioxygenase subunit alpha n=1 Tax=Aneurinibacillus thermoaerophilus TaxID=143495 RepID=A0A1G7YDV8_ANETH|nr:MULTISPECIES: aromatic ring-hydroxylating dioxygenase subunit alpha [Aneurinibacillus]AMA72220.1 (2Fe-2S)-binding protein [Aneurinibacillus sp. XH2]MED0676506.1 aromatic ring-hydroxylating dioxygenase subunit alpha [Aneurinibacillus thermoaerophilus]MED0679018.1 aromatic ring-hydroxylating dioxygenase subunit alpha [Aneurinibacillus thermoaerophilus]MED0736555.1 aromatic ring-hydroxylating dioxygenase subunit alpha [Aneurinibacillus thermoaerophilus]MED0756059.1 aromatic ring-hydroxylating 